MKELTVLVQRQQEMLAKADLSDSEKAELVKINDSLRQLTAPKETVKTRVTTMKLKDALDLIESEAAAIAKNPDSKRAELLVKNSASLDEQDHKNDPDAIVGIEVMVKESAEANIVAMQNQINALSKKVSELTDALANLSKGEKTEEPGEKSDPEAKGDKKEEADGEKADVPQNCPECNAPMLGKEVCPSCGWKVGDQSGKDQKPSGDKKPAQKSFEEMEKNAEEQFQGDMAPELGTVAQAGDLNDDGTGIFEEELGL